MKITRSDFTHYAWFYGIPCYWNEDTSCLSGRNIVFDWLLEAATVLHNYLVAPFDDRGFPIAIKEFDDRDN